MYQNKRYELPDILKTNAYPGRGIFLGMTPDGRALAGYFIMGRSQNSRNRVFIPEERELIIRPYNDDLVTDPSLIVYRPVREYGVSLIVTNGDQTDTIHKSLSKLGSFESALHKRTFEPDAPNFTPRISGIMDLETGHYKLSILRASDEAGSACDRLFFEYAALSGTGHFIHTYEADGSPLPSFYGEPARINIPEDTGAFGEAIWQALHPDNKIALYLRAGDQVAIFNRYPV